MKELQRLTGVRIKVLSNNESTENKEAIIFIEESFASGQVSSCFVMGVWVGVCFKLRILVQERSGLSTFKLTAFEVF